jgi:succinate dehydrogenase / fumarate reductase, iron-sulfur subunit
MSITPVAPPPPAPTPVPTKDPIARPASPPATAIVETPARTRSFRVFRYRRGTPSRWDRFEVPVPSLRTTVLDALTWIRTRIDPSLDVRHSCFHASCGTCGMRVNGRDVLACVTRLEDLDGPEVTVEPLQNQPLVSDLVVEIEALYASFEAVGMPLVRRSELVPGGHAAEGVAELGRFEDCIECGLCLSACPVASSDAAYAGPGVLGAARRLIEEPRGAHPEHVYRVAGGEQGAWRCHLAFECNEACPSDAMPGEQIAHLRRGLLAHRLRTAFGRRRATTGSGT